MTLSEQDIDVDSNGSCRVLETNFSEETDPFCEACDVQESRNDKVETSDVIIETGPQHRPLVYNVSECPPLHLLIMFAMQQALLCIASPLSKVVLVSEAVCASQEEDIKTQLLSATMLMTGIATFVMPAFGVRLPIFQGPAQTYILSLLSLQGLEEWSCPVPFKGVDINTNQTINFAVVGNGTVVPMKSIIYPKIAQLSGSLILAGAIHFLIGVTGFVGVIVRYVGPISIVPTIILMGLQFTSVVIKFSKTCWLVAGITALTSIILSVYLSKNKTPLPFWTKEKGFHIMWYPLHTVFALLISILVGWALSAVLTETNWLSSDPKSLEFLARTDSKTHVIEEATWFTFPYPGMFGSYSFNVGAFINFFIATLLAVIDSIGDYNACARTAQVPPPPQYAFNRGIAVEGLISLFGGALGCCHATSSYGGNIGAMGITRVVSRRVFQGAGLLYILFALLGKLGAVFITIPYSVLGGITFIVAALFIGVILSFLQTVDLESQRNLSILGLSILIGLMIPSWVKKNPAVIAFGNQTATGAIKMLLTNPAFVGGVFACTLDNTIPGTLRERGLLSQLKELDGPQQDTPLIKYAEGEDLYRLPSLPDSVRKSKLLRFFPIIDKKVI